MTQAMPGFPFTLDRQAIEQLLPHRGPIFACKQLIARAPRIYTGIANWPLDNAVVQGHFPGYPLVPGETEIEPLAPAIKGAKLTFKAKVSAQVIPEIDEEKIKNDLAGRNTRSAQDYLNSLSDITVYELVLWPNLPESLQRIPKTIKRITITLVTGE